MRQEEAKITISAKAEGNMALLWVEDEGQGIPEGTEDKVFDMFYTGVKHSADSRRGIGLGLSLCRSIVQAHGGEIWMMNARPHGAKVSFTLPIADILFEASSAMGTVGVSVIGTPNLHPASRAVLLPMMFLGRIGTLTLAFAVAKRQGRIKTLSKHPEERIMIG